MCHKVVYQDETGKYTEAFDPDAAWVRARLCELQKGCTRLAAASDPVYQLLGHGRWFSPGTLASSTTKAGRHDIAEILLKVALNTIHVNQNYQADINHEDRYTTPIEQRHKIRMNGNPMER